MADVAFVTGVVAFFALAAVLVIGCDRIVRSDEDELDSTSSMEVPR